MPRYCRRWYRHQRTIKAANDQPGEGSSPGEQIHGSANSSRAPRKKEAMQNRLRSANRPIMAGAPSRSSPTMCGAARISPMPSPNRLACSSLAR